MPTRARQYDLVLQDVRGRLRAGAWPPGTRIAATELAAAFGFSATPVREALSRLTGEGLLEDRRGQGFFVRGLGAADVRDLWSLRLACLRIARAPDRPAAASPVAERDPLTATEALFAEMIGRSGGRALARLHGRVALQLGPVRRQEPHLFADLEDEAVRVLAAVGTPGEAACLERFCLRRVEASEGLAGLLQGTVRNGEI